MAKNKSLSRIDAIIDGLESVAHVERDQNGGETVWFDSVEAGEESRQRNRDLDTLFERAYFFGLVVTSVDFESGCIRLQHPDRAEWSK